MNITFATMHTPIRAMLFGAGLALAAAPGLALVATPGHAQESQSAHRTISVVGRAERAAAPDRATVSLGVVTEGKTAADALDANNEAVRALIQRLKDEGVEARDLQTSGFSVQPQYIYPPRREDGSQEPPSIAGYTVSNNVTAGLRDIAKLGDVLDAAVRAGANQIQGISFEVSNADTLSDEARKAAFANAKRKATLYAEAAGATLGPVLSLSEQTNSQPPMPRMMRMEAAKADSVPVETGEQTLGVEVQVVWEIGD